MPATTLALSDEGPLDEMVRRIKAEFLEMPGLQLTRAQAAKLWALDHGTCDAVLTALVNARFLIRTQGAAFVRAQ
jgi:hypothetical protein